ncbi:MAG: hypothetical protein DMF64_20455 [Acidobacteria bacterium]|nr:MAG: hypothetical protein DMF64_20455 [Acidobacteriota bacterium]
MQVLRNKHPRKILTDWTFIGMIVGATALIVSVAIGRISFGNIVLGVLLAVWIITLVLLYERVLEVLAESKSSRQKVLSEIKKLQIESRNAIVTQTLPVISMEAFAQLESQLTEGDSVLVFANTLEVDYQPMFDAVVGNLKKGVIYKYILFKEEQIDDWERFIRLLKREEVTNLPEAVFAKSRTATLLRSSTAIYDYEDNNRKPDGFCVLETTHVFDTCIMLSQVVAKQTRDAYIKVWRMLSAENHVVNLPLEERIPPKQLDSPSTDHTIEIPHKPLKTAESTDPAKT